VDRVQADGSEQADPVFVAGGDDVRGGGIAGIHGVLVRQ
jgi:hypothetical protein